MSTDARLDRLIIAVSCAVVFVVISVSTLRFTTLTPNLLLVWPLPYDAVARMVDAVQLIICAAVLLCCCAAVLLCCCAGGAEPERRGSRVPVDLATARPGRR